MKDKNERQILKKIADLRYEWGRLIEAYKALPESERTSEGAKNISNRLDEIQSLWLESALNDQ